MLTKNDPGSYNGACTDVSQSTDAMTGSSSLGQSGSNYSYSVSDTVSTAININGDSTYGEVVTGLNLFDYASSTQCYSVTGPPARHRDAGEYLELDRGRHRRRQLDPDRRGRHGVFSGSSPASELGTSPPNVTPSIWGRRRATWTRTRGWCRHWAAPVRTRFVSPGRRWLLVPAPIPWSSRRTWARVGRRELAVASQCVRDRLSAAVAWRGQSRAAMRRSSRRRAISRSWTAGPVTAVIRMKRSASRSSAATAMRTWA